jgi:DNA-binding winged helix-turn-helix (wHTH) protein
MAVNRSWDAYPATYRAQEMQTLASWVLSGESGSVVGLIGCGRSNLLGFLCHRPEVLQTYLPSPARPVVLVPVDLNDLPAKNASTLYRVILRSFDRVRDRFESRLQQAAADLYRETRDAQDPFLPQSGLHELLLLFQERGAQIALVLNRFDSFCENASPAMINTLRGLRDNFKDTLCYIVGICQEVAYLNNRTALGDMYDLLDSHVCWVGAMSDQDVRWMITQNAQFATSSPSETEVTTMLRLSGNFPALIKAIVHWWLTKKDRPPTDEWENALFAERSIQYRLARMWDGLTQEEQFVVSEVQMLGERARDAKHAGRRSLDEEFQRLAREEKYALERLKDKGLLVQAGTDWRILGDLLNRHVAVVKDQVLGKIWMRGEQIYQGRNRLELQGIPKAILVFFIRHPYVEHSHDTIMDNAWPPEVNPEGISLEALQQQIKELRKKVEPSRGNYRYIVTFRGGYKFFPEGRTGAEFSK